MVSAVHKYYKADARVRLFGCLVSMLPPDMLLMSGEGMRFAIEDSHALLSTEACEQFVLWTLSKLVPDVSKIEETLSSQRTCHYSVEAAINLSLALFADNSQNKGT